MSVASLLPGPALFLAAGLGLTELSERTRRSGPLLRLAWAYLLGTAACGTGAVLLSFLFSAPLTRSAVVVALASALAGAVRAGRRPRGERPAPVALAPRLRLAGAAVAAFAAAVSIAGLLWAVAAPATEWDGFMTWGPLAKWLRAGQSAAPPVLREPAWFVSHPRYPPLVPALAAVAQDLAGTDDERAGRAVTPLFLPAFLGVLYAEGRRRAGTAAALAATLAATLQPVLTLGLEGGPPTVYADFPLGCFGGAGLLLLVAPRARTRADGLLAGLLLAAAALSKAEGALLAVGALAAAALVPLLAAAAPRAGASGTGTRGRWTALAAGLRLRAAALAGDGRLGLAAAVVAAALVVLAGWRAAIPDRFTDDYASVLGTLAQPAVVAGNLGRAGLVWLRRMTSLEDWGLTFAVAPVAAALAFRLLPRRTLLPLLVPSLAPFALAVAACAVSPFPEGLANATTNRFLVQAALPALVLLALLVRRVAAAARAARAATGPAA